MPDETISRVAALEESFRHSGNAVEQARRRLEDAERHSGNRLTIGKARRDYAMAKEIHRDLRKQMEADGNG